METLEVQLRSRSCLAVQRKEFVDDRRDARHDAHLDRRGGRRRRELPAQLAPGRAVERAAHVVVETGVVDGEPGHRQARDAREPGLQETAHQLAVSGGKLLEHDHRRLELARAPDEGGGQQADNRGEANRVAVEMALASDAPDHQGAQLQEARPEPPHRLDRAQDPLIDAGEKVLVEQEEGLDGQGLAVRVLDDLR